MYAERSSTKIKTDSTSWGIDSCQEGNAFKAFAQKLPLLQDLGINDTRLNLAAGVLLCLVQSALNHLPRCQATATLLLSGLHASARLAELLPPCPACRGVAILSSIHIYDKILGPASTKA